MNWKLLVFLVLVIFFLAYTDAGEKDGYRKGRKHPPKYDHDDDDDHDHDDKDRDGCDDKKGGHDCGKKYWAKILVCIGAAIALIGLIVGVTICVIRLHRRQRRQITDSTANLQSNKKKAALYIVDLEQSEMPPPYSEVKPTAPTVPGWPVVSTENLPGKE